MLKNKKIVYFCQECGYESSKWMGQCPGCKAWNTLVEETISTKKGTSSGIGSFQNSGKRPEPVRLKDISLSEDERQLTKIGELDRVLGGGIVPGFGGWRSGNRKIHPSFTGMQKSGTIRKKCAVYFRRGIPASD